MCAARIRVEHGRLRALTQYEDIVQTLTRELLFCLTSDKSIYRVVVSVRDLSRVCCPNKDAGVRLARQAALIRGQYCISYAVYLTLAHAEVSSEAGYL